MKTIYFIITFLIIYIFLNSFQQLHYLKKVIIILVNLVLMIVIYCVGNDMGVMLYIITMFFVLMLRFIYGVIRGAKKINQEKRLFTNIESKLRFAHEVIRTEQEDFFNIFCRCIISKIDNQDKIEKTILIMPFIPNELYFIDYNGNCINSIGRYDQVGYLENYAPYNELADYLAKAGYLVIRLDMIGTKKKQVCVADYFEDIQKWVLKIHEQNKVDGNPIVIAHRETGIIALDLMKKNNWKNGIFICCGLNYRYLVKKKSCYDYLKQLTKEYSILQIDAGNNYCLKNKKEKVEDLECTYKIIKIDDMDFTLRKINRLYKDELSEKGYKILCGTGKYPPISDELVDVIINYLFEI